MDLILQDFAQNPETHPHQPVSILVFMDLILQEFGLRECHLLAAYLLGFQSLFSWISYSKYYLLSKFWRRRRDVSILVFMDLILQDTPRTPHHREAFTDSMFQSLFSWISYSKLKP
jgi:hypothetical protein